MRPLIKKVKQGIDGCILVDFDSKQPRHANFVRVNELLRLMGLTPEWVRYDRTRNGWHMVVRVKEFSTFHDGRKVIDEILIAQSVLGDDPRRAAFNFRRLRAGIWLNQLFEPEKK